MQLLFHYSLSDQDNFFKHIFFLSWLICDLQVSGIPVESFSSGSSMLQSVATSRFGSAMMGKEKSCRMVLIYKCKTPIYPRIRYFKKINKRWNIYIYFEIHMWRKVNVQKIRKFANLTLKDPLEVPSIFSVFNFIFLFYHKKFTCKAVNLELHINKSTFRLVEQSQFAP